MTEIVRSPDAPLVDPETGETPPLSPVRLELFPEWADYEAHLRGFDRPTRRAFIDGTWDVTEPDDGA